MSGKLANQQTLKSTERMLVVRLLRIIAGSEDSRGPGTSKLLAHKMASETKRVSGEKVSQIEEATETKKHRGIPEALFLVSI